MAKKPVSDLLGPRGDDQGADHVRQRLRKRVELERGITMPGRQVDFMLRCLDTAATYERIKTVNEEVKQEIAAPLWSLEIEPRFVEVHGAWRYEGRPEVMAKDMERAALFYALAHTMDSLLTTCGFPMVRTRDERLDDAAWYGVPERER